MLRAFHLSFVTRQFAAERAAHFQATCPDGSQPLIWTQQGSQSEWKCRFKTVTVKPASVARYFNEYRELFEMHLRHILHGLGMTEDTFHELCGYLQEMMLGVCGVCAFASICLPFVAFHIRDHSKDIETASCGKSLNSQGGNRVPGRRNRPGCKKGWEVHGSKQLRKPIYASRLSLRVQKLRKGYYSLLPSHMHTHGC